MNGVVMFSRGFFSNPNFLGRVLLLSFDSLSRQRVLLPLVAPPPTTLHLYPFKQEEVASPVRVQGCRSHPPPFVVSPSVARPVVLRRHGRAPVSFVASPSVGTRLFFLTCTISLDSSTRNSLDEIKEGEEYGIMSRSHIPLYECLLE
jgi:hypothetical protein